MLGFNFKANVKGFFPFRYEIYVLDSFLISLITLISSILKVLLLKIFLFSFIILNLLSFIISNFKSSNISLGSLYIGVADNNINLLFTPFVRHFIKAV